MQGIEIKSLLNYRVVHPYFFHSKEGVEAANLILKAHRKDPNEILCVSFAGIKMVSVSFLTSLLTPLIQANLDDKSSSKIIFSDMSLEVQEEVYGMIALHLKRCNPKQKDYGLVLLEQDKVRFLGPMGKAVKASWKWLESKQDQSHSVESFALSRERSRSSCARHLQVLRRLGLVQRIKKAQRMIYWVTFSDGASSSMDIWSDNDIPAINCYTSGSDLINYDLDSLNIDPLKAVS